MGWRDAVGVETEDGEGEILAIYTISIEGLIGWGGFVWRRCEKSAVGKVCNWPI